MTFNRLHSGNTLIEVLVSLSLLLTGTLAYFQFDAKLIDSNHQAIQRTEATQLLQAQMKKLAHSGNIGESGTKTSQVDSRSYKITWRITASTAGRTIDASIAWKDKNGDYTDWTLLELRGDYSRSDYLALSLLPPRQAIYPQTD